MTLSPKEHRTLSKSVRDELCRIETLTYYGEEFGELYYDIEKFDNSDNFNLSIVFYTKTGKPFVMAKAAAGRNGLENLMNMGKARMDWLVKNPGRTMLEIMKKL